MELYSIQIFVCGGKLRPSTRRERSSKGTVVCGNRGCQVCKHLEPGERFTSYRTGKSYTINYELDCNSSNVVYLLSCKVCHALRFKPKFCCCWPNVLRKTNLTRQQVDNIERARLKTREETLAPRPRNATDRVPMVVTYHPSLPNIGSLCTDVPPPSGKIGRGDVCESPSLIVFRYTFA